VSESIASNGFLPSGGYAEDAEDKPMLILKKSVDVGHGLTALINRQLQGEWGALDPWPGLLSQLSVHWPPNLARRRLAKQKRNFSIPLELRRNLFIDIFFLLLYSNFYLSTFMFCNSLIPNVWNKGLYILKIFYWSLFEIYSLYYCCDRCCG